VSIQPHRSECECLWSWREEEIVYCPMHAAAPEMLELLKAQAKFNSHIADPSPVSLIGRTRALLDRLACSAPTPKETAMDFDAFRDRLKARLAKLREKFGHDDPDVQAMEKELEAPEGEKAGEPGGERP
jgi:hypothetical protein